MCLMKKDRGTAAIFGDLTAQIFIRKSGTWIFAILSEGNGKEE